MANGCNACYLASTQPRWVAEFVAASRVDQPCERHHRQATLQIRARPNRQPSTETGLYLHRHAHTWREIGTHAWPNGTVDPVFRCKVCGDVIACRARDEGATAP